jgi:hypothetical protein
MARSPPAPHPLCTALLDALDQEDQAVDTTALPGRPGDWVGVKFSVKIHNHRGEDPASARNPVAGSWEQGSQGQGHQDRLWVDLVHGENDNSW